MSSVIDLIQFSFLLLFYVLPDDYTLCEQIKYENRLELESDNLEHITTISHVSLLR